MSDSRPLSRRTRLGLGALALVLAGGIAARLAFGGGPVVDADDLPPPPPQATLVKAADGTSTLQLAEGQAQALGLSTAVACATSAVDAQPIHGVILDPLPILDLDAKRRDAAMALRSAQAAEAEASAELARIRTLHASDRGASDRALQAAERVEAEARARVVAAGGEARRAQAAWTQTGLTTVAGLADFRELLVRLDLPLGQPAPAPLPHQLEATIQGASQPRALRILGLAPGGSPLTGGLALLARLPGAGLRPGLPVDVGLPGAAGARVRVPRAAMLWSGDQAQVFVQVGEGRFQPRSVTPAFPLGDSLVLSAGLKPGEAVVVNGALALEGEYARLAEGKAIGAGGV
ncbi:MAG TPA: hypothetical protein VF768_10055 [Holophagaceae bacterium]